MKSSTGGSPVKQEAPALPPSCNDSSGASMKRLILALVAFLFALPAAAKQPNILWIVSEDNNPLLGCYGDPYAKTPNLDKLAAAGVRYTRAFANAPVCAPSRSTLISSVYASTLGTYNMRSRYAIPSDFHFYCTY